MKFGATAAERESAVQVIRSLRSGEDTLTLLLDFAYRPVSLRLVNSPTFTVINRQGMRHAGFCVPFFVDLFSHMRCEKKSIMFVFHFVMKTRFGTVFQSTTTERGGGDSCSEGKKHSS